ncbi:TonB-dependent receptor-like protein [Mucilaginibacter gracilis]|uniref:TonB-dependent receptor-like protein n=2 Tax=Mucilaginibacter gracilis TaxID=423350 RepID=A0A495IZG1_9SPHI|nr:TonB-dependent receptor-like protein [Mucilaginibacter gracilis]
MYNSTKSSVIKRLYFMTRLTMMVTVISFTLSGVLLASEVRSQRLDEAIVSVHTQKSSLNGLLSDLSAQSGFNFVYAEELGKINPVSLNVSKTSLDKVLALLAKQHRLHFEQINSAIAVSKLPPPAVPGKISGKVLDEKGETLPGATIKLVETGQAVQSNADGSYVLSVAPGTYTIEVNFIGYQSQRITGVVASEGKLTPLDLAMKPANTALKEVMVTAAYRKASLEGLYAKQKNNAGITDGVTAEQLARTPDKNLGESLKRISGLATIDNKYVVVRGLSERYNNAELNGQSVPSTELNRKAFSFDIIPSNMVDAVTVTKTLTPDKSAEFGGGLVQVQTKDIPDENFTTLNIGGSVNSNTTGKDFLTLPMETRNYFALPAGNRNLFGKLDWKSSNDVLANTTLNAASGNYDVNDPKAFANNWGLSKLNPAPAPNLQFSLGRVYSLKNNQRIGLIASAGYRNTFLTQDIESTRFGFEETQNPLIGKRYGFTANLSGLAGLSYGTERLKLGLQSIYLRTLDQQLLIGTGNKDGFKQLGYFDQTTASSLSQNQLKGEYAIGNRGIKLNWLGSYIRLDRLKPDNHIMTAAYQADPAYGPDEYYISQPQSDLSRGALRSWSRALENNFSWNTDLQVPFQFNTGQLGWANSLKAGYAGWQKDRLFYVLNSGSSANTSYFPALADAFDPNRAGTSIEFSRFGDDFHKKASLHAAYLMLDNKVAGKLRLVWGLRAEYYNLNGLNQNLDQIKASVKQYDFSALDKLEPNWNFFPSANLTYSLTPKMNLRLAFAKSIIRPDLRELTFFQEYDYELGGVYNSQTPIRSTKISHYDFRYEWFPSPGELISFSLFRKQFDYPMEIYKDQNNRLFTLQNNKAATNNGIEAEFRKSFAFTGIPVLKQLTLYGNFTALTSTVTPMTLAIGANDPAQPGKVLVTENTGAPEKRVQTGASNLMYNAGFYYDTQPVRVSMSYNYVSNRLIRPTVDYSQSLFERPEKALDAQVAVFLLKKKLEIKGTVSNLLNSYSVVYQNVYDQGSLTAKEPTTQQLRYQAGVDQINYKSASGRTYSLNFTYNF